MRETAKHMSSTLLAFILTVGLAALFAGVPAEASAKSSSASGGDGMNFSVGARIGGLGFRHAKNDRLDWADCRMNGSGVFATLEFHRNFFAELSAEFYHATGATAGSGMDRISMYVLGAAGARILPDFLISPYLQLGVGPEWTRIDTGEHSHTTFLVAPFAGLGAELNLGSLKFGTHVRTYLMGLPDHGHGADSPSGESGEHESLSMYYEAAGQMQFFARWTF